MKFIYYRPEVNGLRGVAVMGAVFYHAELIFQSFRIFPGGFLGVDIFFVISGYLITSLILKEMSYIPLLLILFTETLLNFIITNFKKLYIKKINIIAII